MAQSIKKQIHVVLEGGLVREVVGLEPNTQVVVLDYDLEDHPRDDLQPSPLDGELCFITHF